MSTKGQIIKCKAAVVRSQDNQSIETIQVYPPNSNEVRIQVKACGLCGSDGHILRHPPPYTQFPIVLGHEAAGVVESVGDEVTSVSAGDHVMVTFMTQCRKCVLCKSDYTNLCHEGTADGNPEKFTMFDGTTRIFTNDGQPLYKYLSVGGFAEYIVTTEDCVTKICKDIPMDKFCIFACGIVTGYGSASIIGKVRKGQTVAIWGSGAVGLGAIRGAKDCGAEKVIAIDRSDKKKEIALKFGATTFINSSEIQDMEKHLKDNFGGIDVGIDCVGNVPILKTSFAACKPWGTTVIAGISLNPLEVIPLYFIPGRSMIGGPYGGFKGKDAVMYFIKRYKDMPLDDMIGSYVSLDDINKAFDDMGKEVVKTVVVFK